MITLKPDDEFELRYLRDRLEREADLEHRRDEDQQRREGSTYSGRGGRFTDKERDDRKAIEVLIRMLQP